MKSQVKPIMSKTKLHVYCKHGFWSSTQGNLLVSLDDLDNVSILLDKDK